MIKDVKYSGYTAQPSDYEGPDGDLAMSMNLINEDGDVKQLGQPKNIFSPNRNIVGAVIHKPVESVENCIAWTEIDNVSYVGYYSMKEGLHQYEYSSIIDLDDSIRAIQPFGKIIVLSGSKSVHYIIWKRSTHDEQGGYTYLGTSLPDINTEFALKGVLKASYSKIEYEVGEKTEIAGSDEFEDMQNLRTLDIVSLHRSVSSRYFGVQTSKMYYSENSQVPITNLVFHKGCRYRFDIVYPNLDKAHQPRLDPEVCIYGKEADSELSEIQLIAKVSMSTMTFNPEHHYDSIFLRFYNPLNNSDAQNFESSTDVVITLVEAGEESDVPDPTVGYNPIKETTDSVSGIMGALNKYVNERATLKSKHVFPFMARAAIRLFDDSFASLSAPCLLIPNSGYAPNIRFDPIDDKRFKSKNNLRISSFIAELQIKIELPANIANWEDIIKSVDIFITPPFYPYNQAAEYDLDHSILSYVNPDELSYGVLALNSSVMNTGYKKQSIIEAEKIQFGSELDLWGKAILRIADVTKDEGQYLNKLSNAANFYHLVSIPYEELNKWSEFKSLDIPDGTLSSLVARQRLDDSILPHSGYAGISMHSYNNRLSIFNGSKLLPLPHKVESMSGFQIKEASNCDMVRITVYMDTADGPKTCSRVYSQTLVNDIHWFFYPDANAYKAKVEGIVRSFDENWEPTQIVGWCIEIPLKEHPFLNGAYYLDSSLNNSLPFLNSSDQTSVEPSSLESEWATSSLGSSIYLSETNNPFVFPASKVVGFPSRVMALSTAAKALSQGQFGQFPLYAFTDEGVWAISVNDVGSYSARQPITRDVCINPAGITQIDSAVLFPSDRGIMLLAGSEVICISEPINSDTPFNVAGLKGMDRIHGYLGHKDLYTCLQLKPFSKFLEKAGMIYDYSHQRIIVYNPDISYAYVWSLKSRLWSLMESHIKNSVNSYPEALALAIDPNDSHDTNLNMVDFSQSADRLVAGLLVSRPLKLAAPDILKTVDTVIQRGNFLKGHVKSVLYGSRDLVNWHIVWSSKDHYLRGFHGSPYKYFRIALLCDLAPDESIYGATVQFTPRLTNQPR